MEVIKMETENTQALLQVSSDSHGGSTCDICGRQIWADDSIKRGVGSKCWQRLKHDFRGVRV